jgi:hypothetical protein
MPNHIDLDHRHCRAIVEKIGEKLRASLKPEPELPARFIKQIDRIREVEDRSLQHERAVSSNLSVPCVRHR